MTSSDRRTALVTGGSSGIGLAIAHMLAGEGYALTLTARRPEKLEAAVLSLRQRGAPVKAVPADLSVTDQASSVVASHEARYGRLDVLVQSAGIGFYAPVIEQRPKALELEIALNFRTPYYVLRAALPMLLSAGAEHGKALVVNISSFNGLHPVAGLASYSATKAALNALSRAVQAEVGERGVQVTALCPGYVDTPMSNYWSEQVPKRDMLQADDLAEAVRFLLRTSAACRVPEILLARGNGEM